MPKEAFRLPLEGSVSVLGLGHSVPIFGIGNVTLGQVPKPASGGLCRGFPEFRFSLFIECGRKPANELEGVIRAELVFQPSRRALLDACGL